jgi:hypothetical protein
MANKPGIGPQTFASIGAGVSDIFAGFGAETKAQGDLLEAQSYNEAAQLAAWRRRIKNRTQKLSASSALAPAARR